MRRVGAGGFLLPGSRFRRRLSHNIYTNPVRLFRKGRTDTDLMAVIAPGRLAGI
jgi:hypothetical protein